MGALRTWRQIESPAVFLSPLISRHNLLKLSNPNGANKLLLQRRRHTRYVSISVAPPPLSVTAVISPMADTNFSTGVEHDSVDRSFTEIIVIRHGETEWNAEKRIQGHLDIDLNDVGRQQALAVAERLSRESKISAVYSSDLKRALETAETIASRCGGLQVIQDPNLRERHLGDLQGLVYSDAPKMKTKAYEALQSHGNDVEIPGGGESLNQLYKRCTNSLQAIGSKHRGERVVVVTHGGVIRALHERASLGTGRRAGRILNVSVNVLHLSDPDKWVIKSWGDVSHLNGAGYLDSGFGGDRTSG
ncbi:putative phosphoserine phosphatase [Helianthus annuus]|nr:putative phosphoserine phosphatase [Helianthus annuus]KAJ0694647.1 putative phosphoserine phosphatase [Helianthus annuus]